MINNRFTESINCYRSAIQISGNDIQEINDKLEILNNQTHKKTRFKRDESKNSLDEENIQPLKRELNEKNEIWANRMFQLAQAYVQESRNTTTQSWQSAIDTYQLVNKTYTQQNIYPHRVILICIELSSIYFQMGNIQKSEMALTEAEDQMVERGRDNMPIPKRILENKIKIQKALLAKEAQNLYAAAELFTTVLVY